jgi:XTP/dITP diphosphohydrolase
LPLQPEGLLKTFTVEDTKDHREMRKILIATSNPGKLRDFAGAAAPHGIAVASIPNFSSLPLVVEDGQTFEDNARKKAEEYSEYVPGEIVLADDSGLEIDALNGAPGVHSARYAADEPHLADANTDDHLNNARVLRELKDVPSEKRNGRFVCVLAAARDGKTLATFRGTADGIILDAPRGINGFGYDPLFYFPQIKKTFAELSPEEKANYSHRGAAFRQFLNWCAKQFPEDYVENQVTVKEAKPPKALIFDMDGVLIDSEPLHKRAKELAFGEIGLVLPESVYDSYKGRPDATVIPEMLGEKGLSSDQIADVLHRKHQIFEKIEHEIKPVPGAAEFVLWAKSRYQIALATSATARNREAALKLLGIGNPFEAVVDSGRRHRPKPDPEVFQIAMRDLESAPIDCWIIEDSTNGLRAAKAAKCFAVGITTTFDSEALRQAGADLIVHSFAELRTQLEGA